MDLNREAVTTWKLLCICLKTEENQENLCEDGWSQDLLDARLFLVNSPSDKRIQSFPGVFLTNVLLLYT
jgi:hypothetical protein